KRFSIQKARSRHGERQKSADRGLRSTRFSKVNLRFSALQILSNFWRRFAYYYYMNTASEQPSLGKSNVEAIQEKAPMENETLFQRVVRYSKTLAQFVQLLLGLMTD